MQQRHLYVVTNNSPQNSWYKLILTAFTFAFAVALQIKCMPVLFKEISDELNLSLVEVGTVWGMISLGSLVVMPLGGLLSDRFGVRRTIVFVCLLTGLTCALRGISNGFSSLIATTFLGGLMSAANIPALNVAASLVAPSRRQGLAQGLLAAGSGLGGTIGQMVSATIFSPLLGGWRNVLFLYGGIAIIFGLLWLIIMKEPEKIKSEAVTIITIPFRQAFSHLFHIKNIWLLALSMLASHSCMMGMSGFLPLYLRGNGWTTATADGALAIYSGVGALAVIPLTILSDRLGSRKLGLFVAFTVTILGVGLLSIIHNEFVWALVIVSGIFSMLISPLLVTICIETKEIGSAYAGTAIGLINSLSNLGAFISPPLGNSLASISYGLPFVFWAVLAACGLVILNFIKETGWRSQGG